LCAEHQQSFLDILGDVPDRLATMMVSVAKQAVMGGNGGSVKNDDDRPLPLNIGASDARLILRAELVSVVVRVQHCLGIQPRNTERDVPGVCAWLARHMPQIAGHPEATEWYGRIRKAYDRTTKAIDLPPERVRAGRCSCNAVLYTIEGRETVQCKPCGLRYNVQEMRDAEIAKVRGYTGTATEVLRVLAHAGIKMKLKKLTSWAEHKQVTYTVIDGTKHYTVGDVHDVYKAKLAEVSGVSYGTNVAIRNVRE
jgi:hypothetical protein